MREIRLDGGGLYDPGRAGTLRQARDVMAHVDLVRDVFRLSDEQPQDILRGEPGAVSLCDYQPPDRSLLIDGNLRDGELHAVVENNGAHARVDYTESEGVKRYRVEFQNGDLHEVVHDTRRGIMAVTGGDFGMSGFLSRP